MRIGMMPDSLKISLCLIVSLLSNTAGSSSENIGSLEALYQEADIVAFVRVTAGDSYNFKGATYRADVLDAYKGCSFKDVLFFGPSRGYEVDSQYLVFLRKTRDTVQMHLRSVDSKCDATYDPDAPYSTFLLHDYYTEMPVIFSFGEKIIGYAVRFPCEKISVPEILPSVRLEADDGISKYCLLSRDTMDEYLRELSISD